jgi:hypothetical protein
VAADELDAVRGKQGPRGQRENLYERKTRCECEDRRGMPASILDLESGDCMRCGHRVDPARLARSAP